MKAYHLYLHEALDHDGAAAYAVNESDNTYLDARSMYDLAAYAAMCAAFGPWNGLARIIRRSSIRFGDGTVRRTVTVAPTVEDTVPVVTIFTP